MDASLILIGLCCIAYSNIIINSVLLQSLTLHSRGVNSVAAHSGGGGGGGGINICFSHLSVKPVLIKYFLNYYILFIFTSNGRLFFVCVFWSYLSIVMTVDHNCFSLSFFVLQETGICW